MSERELACILLEVAGRDVTALRGMDDTTVFADEIFGFHVQQATEKLLKAWLALLGERYPATHDLRRLLEILTIRQPEAAHFDALIDYSPYAVQFRYGVADAGIEPIDRGEAVRRVEFLMNEVQRRLPKV